MAASEKLIDDIEKLVQDLLTASLSPVQVDLKRNRLAGLLIQGLNLSKYGLNKTAFIGQTLDGGMDWQDIKYNPEAFVKAMTEAMDNYYKEVPSLYSKFWYLFQTYYNKKSAGTLAEQLKERDFETARLKETKIKDHLAKLANANPSDFQFEVLNRSKTEKRIKEILHLSQGAVLPVEEKDFLDEIFTIGSMPSLNVDMTDEEGGTYGETKEENGMSLDEYREREADEEASNDAISKLLKIYRDCDDEVLLGFVSYQILKEYYNGEKIDKRVLACVPQRMKQLYEQEKPGDLDGDRNKFLGKYFDLRPDTMRKKIDRIKIQLMAQAGSRF